MRSLKKRLNKVEENINPTRYAIMEDILEIIHLKRQKFLAERERQILEELESLPIHPDLQRTLEELSRRRNESQRGNQQ